VTPTSHAWPPAPNGEGSPYAIPVAETHDVVVHHLGRRHFGALLFGYGYLRIASTTAHSFQFNPSIVNVLIMTVVLITSSLTMLGPSTPQNGDKAKTNRFYGQPFSGFYFRRAPHPRMVRLIDEAVRLFSTLGFAFVRATFFSITACTAARDLRRRGVDCDLARFLSRLADCRHVETTVSTAFRRSGLDVCGALDLSAQHSR